MNQKINYKCPICKTEFLFVPRHPHIVCSDCAERVTDEKGNALFFFNNSLAGGCEAEYTVSKKPYLSNKCFIDGIPCIADEGRFGGIVIEVGS